MNKVILIGRTTRDPEIKGEGDKKAALFTLAVDKWTGTERSADFINCVAFRKSADLMQSYVKKGSKIAVEGKINTGSYTNKEGKKVYTTEVYVDRIEFVDTRKEDAAPADPKKDDWMTVPDGGEELPFA